MEYIDSQLKDLLKGPKNVLRGKTPCTYFLKEVYTPLNSPFKCKDFIVYHKNGDLHRDGDLPAMISQFNSRSGSFVNYYIIDGVLHRTNGPAIISNHTELYFLKGIQYTGPEFRAKICEMNIENF